MFLTNKTFNANACMYNVLSAAASGRRVNRFVYIGRAAGPQRRAGASCPNFLPARTMWSRPAGIFLFCFCYLSIKWWHNFLFCLSPAGGRRMLHHFVFTLAAAAGLLRLTAAAASAAGLRICTRSWLARSERSLCARSTRTQGIVSALVINNFLVD